MAVNQLKYDQLASNDLIILNDLVKISSGLSNELRQYVEKGGNLLVFPSASADKSDYNSMLGALKSSSLQDFKSEQKEVKTINTKEFVFDGVFENRQANNLRLPISKGNFQLGSFQSRVRSSLLKYRDGSDYLVKNQLGRGYVYLSAAPLDKSKNDLVSNAEVFVPMVYKMALSNADGGKIAYTIGVDQVLSIDKTRQSAEDNFKFTGNSEFIPGQFNNGSSTILDVGSQIKEAGFYTLSLDNKKQGVYAYNYNNKESELDYYSAKELQEMYGEGLQVYDEVSSANFKQLISEKESGISLWRWFLIGALLFLMFEQLFIRFLKN